jgi:murein DD-endopeptidase MepM/ murein hydrolase activator NlpD
LQGQSKNLHNPRKLRGGLPRDRQSLKPHLLRAHVNGAHSHPKPRKPADPPSARPPLNTILTETHADDPIHHRWLLTTCITGFVGSLVIGSLILGFFGNDGPRQDAYAAVLPETAVEPISAIKTATLAQPAEIVPVRSLSGDQAYPEITADELPYGDGKTIVLDAEIQAAEHEAENITTISKTPPAEPVDESFAIAQGNTLLDELLERGISKDVAQSLVAAIEPIFPARMIKAGTRFELTLDRQQDFYGRDAIFPVELSFKPGPKETITVEADDDGHFVASLDGKTEGSKSQYATITQFRTKARVGPSLYATAKDYKIPDYIISEMVRVFSYDVDFQRQVKPNDSFEVFYGNPLTGSSTKRKVLHYAQLTLDGEKKTYYRFVDADGRVDYIDGNGRSANKALLKTPVSGSKLTSGFGMRRHPLLGYTKMHTGLDFGAPPGTPIRAAAAGTVEVAGRHGAYGIAVELKHANKFETLYAHMSKLAAGVRRGTRVNQGQIIGYVGSTGRSTGPHLHYEVRVNNKPVNPLKVKSSGNRQLAGKELRNFKAYKQRVATLMQTAPSAVQVAQNQ